MKVKTTVMTELNGLMPKMELFHVDGDIKWAMWKEFKVLYNINGALLHSLVKEHASFLKLKGSQRTKKSETRLEANEI